MCFKKFPMNCFHDFIYLFLDGKDGGEGEKHQCVVASHAPSPSTAGQRLVHWATPARTFQCIFKHSCNHSSWTVYSLVFLISIVAWTIFHTVIALCGFFKIIFCYSITVVSIFLPYPPLPIPPPAPTVHSHPVVHVCGSFIHVLWLIASLSFHYYLPSPSLTTVSLFHVSMPVVLFCSLVSFVH